MPTHYPAELRRRTCERMLAGEAIKDLVVELGISHRGSPPSQNAGWVGLATTSTYRSDAGVRPGVPRQLANQTLQRYLWKVWTRYPSSQPLRCALWRTRFARDF